MRGRWSEAAETAAPLLINPVGGLIELDAQGLDRHASADRVTCRQATRPTRSSHREGSPMLGLITTHLGNRRQHQPREVPGPAVGSQRPPQPVM